MEEILRHVLCFDRFDSISFSMINSFVHKISDLKIAFLLNF
jgi:hypothetical protein